MKKSIKILFVVGLFLLVSCEREIEVTVEKTTESVPNNQYKEFEYGDIDVYHIQEIDGCEYILVNGRENSEPALTHKGNCKYCLERNKTIVNFDTKKEEY
jgi:hypothetical protein